MLQNGSAVLQRLTIFVYLHVTRSNGFAGLDYSYYQNTLSNHHRIEIRQYWSVPVAALGGLHNQQAWKGLQSVVMVVSERRLWNQTTYEVRFYLSSLVSNAAVQASAIRTHWGIENNVHWVLDVSFKEDASRIRKDNAAENFALLRRIALNLLNREQTVKGSVRMKRYRAAMDNNYLLKVLAASKSKPTVEVETTKEV